MMESQYRAVRVFFTEDAICVQLADGQEVRTPLEYYPRLKNASAAQRMRFEISGPIAEEFHQSGLTEEELSDLLEKAKHEARGRRHPT